jgi:hypothetical protein
MLDKAIEMLNLNSTSMYGGSANDDHLFKIKSDKGDNWDKGPFK